MFWVRFGVPLLLLGVGLVVLSSLADDSETPGHCAVVAHYKSTSNVNARI
jgi:hypothetical protein